MTNCLLCELACWLGICLFDVLSNCFYYNHIYVKLLLTDWTYIVKQSREEAGKKISIENLSHQILKLIFDISRYYV